MTELGQNWERDDLGGGQFRHTQFLAPIAYLDGGLYRPIATDWLDSGDGIRPHIVSAAPMIISSSGDGLRRFHPTRELDRYIEIGAPFIKTGGVWGKAQLGSPTRIGNLLRWTTQPANMYIWMAGHFAKLTIRLKTAWRPEDGLFAFPVGMSGFTRQGGVILRDGVPVMRIRAPHVEDANNPDDVRPIEWDFVQLSGQTYILFTLPFLETGKVWDIDPTLEIQPDETAGLDTFIASNLATTNFGTNAELRIGERNTQVSINRTLLNFDWSALPDGISISSCITSLYATGDFSSNARDFRVYRLLRNWVELEATWNIYSTLNNWQTAGGFGALDCEQTDIGSRAFTATETLNEFKDFTLNVTTRAALVGSGYGLLFKADTESDDGYSFASASNATAANRPKIAVVYSLISGRGLFTIPFAAMFQGAFG